jgi:protein gp37
MGADSKIEWTDHTFNPWTGCEKVSPACDHCYAEAWAKRTGHPERWQGERVRTSAANWSQPLKWNREAETAGVRRRVFCASLADVLDNKVPEEWRTDLWALIKATPHLDWLLLTKRIGNALNYTPWLFAPPWPNVWIGATVVNQVEADRDIPKLLNVPARVRFLSIEPMLGPIDLTAIRDPSHFPDVLRKDVLRGRAYHEDDNDLWTEIPHIHWTIAGGESGAHARPLHIDWVRSLRDQCRAARVAFHYKQHGEWIDAEQLRPYESGQMPALNFEQAARLADGRPYQHQSDGSTVIRVGKKLAGRTLDGRTWDEVPA